MVKVLKIYKSIFLLLTFIIVFTGCGKSEDNNNALNISKTNQIKEFDSGGYILSEGVLINNGMISIIDESEKDAIKYGFINLETGTIIEPQYIFSGIYNEGVAFVSDGSNKYYIDTEGKKVIETVGNMKIGYGDFFRDGYAVMSLYSNDIDEHPKAYIIDNQGEIVMNDTDDRYNYFNIGKGNFQVVEKYEGKSELVNLNGSIHSKNSTTYLLNEGEIGFYSNEEFDLNLLGIFDFQAYEEITDYDYQYALGFYSNKAIVVDLNDNILVVDSQGQESCRLLEASEITCAIDIVILSDDVFAINYDSEKGSVLYDFSGNVIASTDYERIYNYVPIYDFSKEEDGYAVCVQDGKYGYIDLNGNQIVECKYDYATNFENGKGLLQSNNKWFVFEPH